MANNSYRHVDSKADGANTFTTNELTVKLGAFLSCTTCVLPSEMASSTANTCMVTSCSVSTSAMELLIRLLTCTAVDT